MSEQPTPPPTRGRARARHRAAPVLPPPLVEGEAEGVPMMDPGQAQLLHHMFAGSENGSGSVSGNEGDGRSSVGSARGHGSPRGSVRGSSPGAGRQTGREYGELDYIPSLPEGFNKRGSLGTPLATVANYYGFALVKEHRMMLYTVSVVVDPPSDEVDDKKIKALVRTKRELIGNYLITGNQLMTTRALQEELLEPFVVNPDDGPSTYTVTLTYLRDVQPHEGCVIHFYNVVVKMIQRHLKYSQLGRHFYNPLEKVQFSAWRLDLWPGFMNSIRSQDGGLMMNVESCWKVLMNQNIFEKMTEIRNEDRLNFQEKCSNAIVGMMVVTPYNPHAYKIDRIDFNSNCSSTFETRNGRVSYTDYFFQKYRQRISQPNQPMLVARPNRRDQRRGMIDDIYLVPELCFPCGLNDQLRANFRLMRDLASCLHMDATNRVRTMQRFMDNVHTSPEVQNELRTWGATFQRTPVQVKARQITHEKIIFGNQVQIPLDDRVDWTLSFRNQKMMQPFASLQNWAIIVPNRESPSVPNLIATMQKVARPIGYTINQPLATIKTQNTRTDGYTNAVNEVIQKARGNVDMIFIILPNPNLDTYSAVKKICSIDHGIPSQCFLAKNLNNVKSLMSICTKMVIQMNAKQGGEPWGVVVPLKNLMVLGYDVHHGAAGTSGSSVAAMTASFSPSVGRCFSKVEKLPSREEVATKVADMFDSCIKAYFKQNGILPSRIMMYRDGVGEGQLRDVYEKELEGIKKCIALRYQQKSTDLPKLTYIVVNKRINTRFFARERGESYKNPPPGTVVDDTVTRPERQVDNNYGVYDFFLVSQTARQGCVSPTYYNVLFDDSGLPPDRIQLFTYKLCHIYFNWSGTVAVPAPCQNAHKLAFLAGTALRGVNAHEKLNYLMHFL
ncbi:Piwi-like protein 1 [Orchesella cincta]|uniref:Piwi-like protein 1 n=1 Tax=Orchesella cincta TaxID=48709 RepID=A0A1D2MBD6_ORCCI|nr:Piwi-like protein 1 [Orchesella cincta]